MVAEALYVLLDGETARLTNNAPQDRERSTQIAQRAGDQPREEGPLDRAPQRAEPGRGRLACKPRRTAPYLTGGRRFGIRCNGAPLRLAGDHPSRYDHAFVR